MRSDMQNTPLFFIFLFSFVMTFSASAIDLRYCHTPSDRISQKFVLCVNDNFKEIGKKLGENLKICENFGSDLNYFFNHCINANFRIIKFHIKVNPLDCTFGNINKVSNQRYAACMRENFSRIESQL